MSSISEIAANSKALEVAKTDKAKETSKTTANYGKTIGNAKLSEEGAKYYEELKKKFSGMDFILVSKDMKDYAKQNASSFGNSNKMVVLIDEEKIERMATDENFRAKYEGLISNAQSKMPTLKNIANQYSGVKAIGMQVNDNGTASFFAVMQKSSKDISDKLAAKREAKKKAEKAEEKRADKKEQQEKIRQKISEKGKEVEDEEDYVILQANSVEELLKKIEEYDFGLRADTVMTKEELSIGQSIDFKG